MLHTLVRKDIPHITKARIYAKKSLIGGLCYAFLFISLISGVFARQAATLTSTFSCAAICVVSLLTTFYTGLLYVRHCFHPVKLSPNTPTATGGTFTDTVAAEDVDYWSVVEPESVHDYQVASKKSPEVTEILQKLYEINWARTKNPELRLYFTSPLEVNEETNDLEFFTVKTMRATTIVSEATKITSFLNAFIKSLKEVPNRPYVFTINGYSGEATIARKSTFPAAIVAPIIPAVHTIEETHKHNLVFHLGVDVNNEPIAIYPDTQTTLSHMIAIGGTGSGKTVFMRMLIEQCLRQGVATGLVDWKKDYTHYANRENIIAYGANLLSGYQVIQFFTAELNQRISDKMQFIPDPNIKGDKYEDHLQPYALVIDELGQLLRQFAGVETKLNVVKNLESIASTGRQFRMRLILATQDFKVEFVPRVISNALSARFHLGKPSHRENIRAMFAMNDKYEEASAIISQMPERAYGRAIACIDDSITEIMTYITPDKNLDLGAIKTCIPDLKAYSASGRATRLVPRYVFPIEHLKELETTGLDPFTHHEQVIKYLDKYSEDFKTDRVHRLKKEIILPDKVQNQKEPEYIIENAVWDSFNVTEYLGSYWTSKIRI